MDPFRDPYFNLSRRLMVFIGIGQNQPYKERLLRYYILCSIFSYTLLTQLCQFFTFDYDVREAATMFQIFILTLSFASLYFTVILRYVKIQDMCRFIVEDWHQLKDDVEIKIMQKSIYRSKWFFMYIAVTFFLFIFLSIFPTILRHILSTNNGTTNRDVFPVSSCTDYLIDRETYYYPIILYQTIILSIVIIVALTCYWWYFMSVQHTCARFSIIIDKIHRPFQSNQHDDNVLAAPIDLSHWLIDIIEYLSRTTEFMGLINSFSENIYLVQIFLGLFLLIIDVICMPLLLKDNDGKHDIFLYIFLIIGTLFPIYMNCYIGQRIIDLSMDVRQEASLVPIYRISVETQKLLLTMLMITTKPSAISIGKMFVSSHEFFSNLLRTAFSFALVVQSMQSI